MKRKIRKSAVLCVLICLCLALSAVSVLAAANPTYVVSFRPGANGSFSSGAETYLSGFGTVKRTAAGNLFVEVPAGSPFPAGIVSYLQADSGYYYRSGLEGSAVNQNMDLTAQYGVLTGSGIRYTVQYVDSASGAELSESYQGYANAGDTLSFTAKTLRAYAVDSASKTLTVSEGAVLRFLYTYDGSNDQTQYTYGENTIINQTVTTVAATAANAGAQTTTVLPATTAAAATTAPAAATTAPAATETIPANSVPQAAGNTEAGANTEVIAESSAPLASGSNQGSTSSNVWLFSGIAAGVLILLVAAAALMKKKKSVK